MIVYLFCFFSLLLGEVALYRISTFSISWMLNLYVDLRFQMEVMALQSAKQRVKLELVMRICLVEQKWQLQQKKKKLMHLRLTLLR